MMTVQNDDVMTVCEQTCYCWEVERRKDEGSRMKIAATLTITNQRTRPHPALQREGTRNCHVHIGDCYERPLPRDSPKSTCLSTSR